MGCRKLLGIQRVFGTSEVSPGVVSVSFSDSYRFSCNSVWRLYDTRLDSCFSKMFYA